jgi:hypothetical protein
MGPIALARETVWPRPDRPRVNRVLRSRPLDAGTLLRLEGEYWTIAYLGQVFRIRDAVGLRHLAQLLWHPEREFHALDLMRALALSGGSRRGRPPCRNGPAVDAHAAEAYRRRVRELHEALAEAETREDLGKTDAIRRELDAILRELRHGTQGRRIKVDVERARVAVTKGIKASLASIRAVHPALADHLDASVKRGYVCVYRPDTRFPIRWDWERNT